MRRMLLLFTAIAAVAASLASPATASAATECRWYDGYGNPPQAGQFCVANADDYPNYNAWGHLRGMCTSPWPADIDDGPIYTCMALSTVPAWKWTSNGWQSANIPSGKAYVWRYAAGWRWVWRQDGGWHAVQSRHVQITWFVPHAPAAPAGRWG